MPTKRERDGTGAYKPRSHVNRSPFFVELAKEHALQMTAVISRASPGSETAPGTRDER
jgi:hypothetical protein